MEDDLEPRARPTAIALGEDLATLSLAELEARISACESEISRLRAAIAEKRNSQATAENFFRS